jgi:hypothetical protein
MSVRCPVTLIPREITMCRRIRPGRVAGADCLLHVHERSLADGVSLDRVPWLQGVAIRRFLADNPRTSPRYCSEPFHTDVLFAAEAGPKSTCKSGAARIALHVTGVRDSLSPCRARQPAGRGLAHRGSYQWQELHDCGLHLPAQLAWPPRCLGIVARLSRDH